MVLYYIGGTIKRAGCLVTGCQIKVASRSHSYPDIKKNKKIKKEFYMGLRDQLQLTVKGFSNRTLPRPKP